MAFGILCSEDWAPSKGARHISWPLLHRCIGLPHIPVEPPASKHHPSPDFRRPCCIVASPFAGFLRTLRLRSIGVQHTSGAPPASKHRASTHSWRPSCIDASGFHTFLSLLLHRCIRLPHISGDRFASTRRCRPLFRSLFAPGKMQRPTRWRLVRVTETRNAPFHWRILRPRSSPCIVESRIDDFAQEPSPYRDIFFHDATL